MDKNQNQNLDTKTKAELLEMGAALGFSVTPAMTKADLVQTLSGAAAQQAAQQNENKGSNPTPGDPAAAADTGAGSNAPDHIRSTPPTAGKSDDPAAAGGPMAPTQKAPGTTDGLSVANARILELEAQLAASNPRAESAAEIARAANSGQVITDKPGDAPLPKEGQLRTLDGALVDNGKVRIRIDRTETDVSDVIVGLNGHLLRIQRGVEVDIPKAYLGVLKDAKIITFTSDPDDVRKRNESTMQRYPFTAEVL